MSSLDLSKNKKIIENIAKAYGWKQMLENQNMKTINSLTDISKKEGVSTRQVRKIYYLNYLSPYIVEKITLNGENPRKLKLGDFLDGFPISWAQQEEWFFC
jgi:uncharacterized protein YidB (DUF937 family)